MVWRSLFYRLGIEEDHQSEQEEQAAENNVCDAFVFCIHRFDLVVRKKDGK